MMIEVIEPAWLEFVAKIGKVSDVDDVLLIHQDFLEVCLHNCMLKSPDLLRSVVKLCNICLNFCKFMQVSRKLLSQPFLPHSVKFGFPFFFQCCILDTIDGLIVFILSRFLTIVNFWKLLCVHK